MITWNEYYQKLREIKKNKRIVFKATSRDETTGIITIRLETEDGATYEFKLKEEIRANPNEIIELADLTIIDPKPINLRVLTNYLIDIINFLKIRRTIEIDTPTDLHDFLKVLKALKKTFKIYLKDLKNMIATSITMKSLADPKFLDTLYKNLNELEWEALDEKQ